MLMPFFKITFFTQLPHHFLISPASKCGHLQQIQTVTQCTTYINVLSCANVITKGFGLSCLSRRRQVASPEQTCDTCWRGEMGPSTSFKVHGSQSCAMYWIQNTPGSSSWVAWEDSTPALPLLARRRRPSLITPLSFLASLRKPKAPLQRVYASIIICCYAKLLYKEI